MCPESSSQPEPLSKVLVGTWELLVGSLRALGGKKKGSKGDASGKPAKGKR